MARPLGGRRPKRKPKPPRSCMACQAQIPNWQWLCDLCFGILPWASKRAICEARASKEPARIYGLSFEAAKNLIAAREQQAAR